MMPLSLTAEQVSACWGGIIDRPLDRRMAHNCLERLIFSRATGTQAASLAPVLIVDVSYRRTVEAKQLTHFRVTSTQRVGDKCMSDSDRNGRDIMTTCPGRLRDLGRRWSVNVDDQILNTNHSPIPVFLCASRAQRLDSHAAPIDANAYLLIFCAIPSER